GEGGGGFGWRLSRGGDCGDEGNRGDKVVMWWRWRLDSKGGTWAGVVDDEGGGVDLVGDDKVREAAILGAANGGGRDLTGKMVTVPEFLKSEGSDVKKDVVDRIYACLKNQHDEMMSPLVVPVSDRASATFTSKDFDTTYVGPLGNSSNINLNSNSRSFNVVTVSAQREPKNVKELNRQFLAIDDVVSFVQKFGAFVVGNKTHKAFPLPVMEFPLPEEVPTASKESAHCQKKRDATVVKIRTATKVKKSNCNYNIVYNDSLSYKRSSLVIVEGRLDLRLMQKHRRLDISLIAHRVRLVLGLAAHKGCLVCYTTTPKGAFGVGNKMLQGIPTASYGDPLLVHIPTENLLGLILYITPWPIKGVLRFWKKTSKKIAIQGSDVAGFDKSKVECFNCHKMGHFAREYKAPRSQDRGKRESNKQGPKVEEPALKALMAIDGIRWDWSYMANEEENDALVADDEVSTEFALIAKGLSQVEARLVEFKENEVKFYERIRVLERDVKIIDNKIEYLKNELEQVKKEKESLDNKLTGFENALKDLDNLLGSQRSDKNKKGLGYTHSNVKRSFQTKSTVKNQPRVLRVSTVTKKIPIVDSKFPTAKSTLTTDLGDKGKVVKGNPQNNIDDKGYWDNGCSRHMTRNISYLFEYEPYDGGYVSFGHGGAKITGKGYWDNGCSRHMTRNISYLFEYEPYDGGYVSFGHGGAKITGKDHLGKFDAKGDEGYFVRNSLSSKGFR
nr:hypothetical protein [Tanacetum cinerariifolium]